MIDKSTLKPYKYRVLAYAESIIYARSSDEAVEIASDEDGLNYGSFELEEGGTVGIATPEHVESLKANRFGPRVVNEDGDFCLDEFNPEP